MVLSKLFNEYGYWIRCIIYVNHHIRNALLDILHDDEYGLPRDPVELYKWLTKEYNKSRKNKFRKYFDSVKDKIEGLILMPSNKESHSQNWDNTVIVRMISIFRKDIKAPIDGWQSKEPDIDEDFPLPAYLILAREIRNLFFHSVICKMTLYEYKLKKENIRNILVGLGYRHMLEFDNDDCLYTIDLEDIRNLLAVEYNSVYICKACGIDLNESEFKAVVGEIVGNLKDYEMQDRKFNHIIIAILILFLIFHKYFPYS